MMDGANSRSGTASPSGQSNNASELVESLARFKQLYPFVDVNELPKSWSPKDKANFISLSDNNLKVHYKGVGKGHKDAAAVRALCPIPAGCLLYYYEIKIISKGRDGYMGIGLAAQGVNMQRLPGWDKQSYGYHGDDGHSFCSSGTGQPYGPTFTTGDVIGCGYNLVEGTCFYTKNGLNLGIAFSDLPSVPLYPTVGLQTPGEEVEANFGMEPFVYDIEQDMTALRKRITQSVTNYPVKYNEWQSIVHKLVQSWLIHNGYCTTAEVFSEATKQEFKENVHSVKQRLRIQQLVLSGKIGEAIDQTNRLYPTVLKDNPNLLFALKCRQFIERVRSLHDTGRVGSVVYPVANSSGGIVNNSCSSSSNSAANSSSNSSYPNSSAANGTCLGDCNGNAPNDKMDIDEDGMDGEEAVDSYENGKSEEQHGVYLKVLEFGKELHSLSQQLKQQFGSNETNKKMLQDAFSLLAYSDPFNSPVGWQLLPSEREGVCQQLNNAIVAADLGGNSHRLPLEIIIKHTKTLLKKNGHCGSWLVDKL